ncbi:Oidioi.mRNA.OKI2018_I69.chr2.g7956.t1.cds [Oikopleura dioica]|uniref:Oidioi.mRNA.OKI2018_I69.chr2.g7956.t1.cds n=1 Tax=Oikopleura dioica TaxID=34765 RepID=A0ABN7TB95_OIKDI|nr:Oidioi.mRNA.OKI2018_I69.chr2.g7956.t1.cds [Oikopleura dioica]
MDITDPALSPWMMMMNQIGNISVFVPNLTSPHFVPGRQSGVVVHTENDNSGLIRLKEGALTGLEVPFQLAEKEQNGKIIHLPEEDKAGVIEWKHNNTCVFVRFNGGDVIDVPDSEKTLGLHDWVDFYREKEKNAAKIICPAKAKRFQGEVCSVKSGYGFIKRLDVESETFFHFSQVLDLKDEADNRVEVGDKVDFSLGNHDKKEVALKIAILPKSFPIIFDDVELDVYGFPMEFEGVITKPCLKKDLSNDKGKKNYKIKYEPGIVSFRNHKYGGRKNELHYFERDRQSSFTLLAQKGDSRIFFHSSEVLDSQPASTKKIKVGDQVEFLTLRDPLARANYRGRCHATRIRIIAQSKLQLSPESEGRKRKERKSCSDSRSISSQHSDDSLSDMLYNGVMFEMPDGEVDGKIQMEKDMSCGEDELTHVRLDVGTKVRFMTRKMEEGCYAVNVQPAEPQIGWIRLVKENFGFIRIEGVDGDIFFHSSEADGFDTLKKDDWVQSTIEWNDRSGRWNATKGNDSKTQTPN